VISDSKFRIMLWSFLTCPCCRFSNFALYNAMYLLQYSLQQSILKLGPHHSVFSQLHNKFDTRLTGNVASNKFCNEIHRQLLTSKCSNGRKPQCTCTYARQCSLLKGAIISYEHQTILPWLQTPIISSATLCFLVYPSDLLVAEFPCN
jgi:hypothetical protein